MKKEAISKIKLETIYSSNRTLSPSYKDIMLSTAKSEENPEERRSFTRLTELLFAKFIPEFYEGKESQNRDCSKRLLHKMNTYFKGKASGSVLYEEELTYLRKVLEDKSHYYSFYNQYGCIIHFRKRNGFEPTLVTLIFPKQWDFRNITHEGHLIYVASDPKSSTYLQIGQIIYEALDIEEQVTIFCEMLDHFKSEQIKMKDKNDPKNHHTPTWLLQIAKYTLEEINRGNIQRDDKKKPKQEQGKAAILSKGGTMDVGQHTGITAPNTSLQTVISLLNYLTGDQQLVKLAMTDFKLKYLSEKIMKSEAINQQQDITYRNCIRSLIFQLKELTNKEIVFKTNDALSKTQKCMKTLDLKIKTVIRKQYDLKEMSKPINQQPVQNFCFNSTSQWDHRSLLNLQIKGNLGFTKPLQIINCFKNLLSNTYEESVWVLMTERFFWKLAIERLSKQDAPIGIAVEEITCEHDNFSIMHLVINRYFDIMNNISKASRYGMMMKNQAYAHIYLIHYIGAAVAFQVVKKQRREKSSHLETFAIPHDINQLYRLFHSVSFEARLALRAMMDYFKRNEAKQKLFCLNGKNKSFYSYAKVVGGQDQKIKDWKMKQIQILNCQVERLQKEINNFCYRYQTKIQDKNSQTVKKCSCRHEWVYRGSRQNRELITCERCNKLQNINSNINSLQKEQFNLILCSYPEKEIDLYGFINNIPNDIHGMMKIIYESQIQRLIKIKTSPPSDNFFSWNYGVMVPYSDRVKLYSPSLHSNYKKPAEEFIRYPSQSCCFYYYNIKDKIDVSSKLLEEEVLQNQNIERYQFMIDCPSQNNSNREHECYSKLYHKGREEKVEEFLSYANVKVSQQAQLPVITEKLKNRDINIKTLIDYSDAKSNKDQITAKTLIILRTAADLCAFRKLSSTNFNFLHYPMVEECILDFLHNYQRKWRYEDLYSMHIIGLIFSLYSMEMNCPEYSIGLARRAYQEYEKYAKENKVGDNALKSQLSYFLHGALACFTEEITKEKDKQSVQLWTIFQILYRINKVFSDQNLKDPRFRQTMVHYDFFRVKAIFQNIENVKDYFKGNLQSLTKIVEIIDKDISEGTVWKYNNQRGEYVFSGVGGGKVYDLNLYTGILLKNNCELAGLPDIVKTNFKYIAIFDIDRDLQIYPETDGSLRTRCNFAEFFHNEPNTIVLFQFKILENDIVIRMIFKRKGNPKEQKYVLVEEIMLQNSNFTLPVLYTKQYFAWYCEEENHIVFRKKPLAQAKEMGLLLLTKKEDFVLKVVESRIIENKFRRQSLQDLKKIQSSPNFDLLRLFQKGTQQYSSKGFQILSAIEHKEYIIQIDAVSEQENKREQKYWLHRYNLKFTYAPNQGLLSDNYQGYAIDSNNYENHELLPWGAFQKVNCLILHQTVKDIKFAKNNSTLVLIPNVKVSLERQARNEIRKGQKQTMVAFSYQIHDNLKDLRGKKRVEQLYLACLIGACYLPHFDHLKMNNEQYALGILRSCLNPVPLSDEQFCKLQNILSNSIKLNQISLILECQAIFVTSNMLNSILPFTNGKIKQKKEEENLFLNNRHLIINCQSKYRTNYEEDCVSVRQKLSTLQLEILGMDKFGQNKLRKRPSKWNLKNKITLQIAQNIQEKIDEWYKTLFSSNQYLKYMIKGKQMERKEQRKPSSLSMHYDEIDVMSAEKKKEMESSCQSYNILKSKYQQIILSDQYKYKCIQQIQAKMLELESTRNDVITQIMRMQEHNLLHCDFQSRKHRFIVQRDFTSVLVNEETIYDFYPHIEAAEIQTFKKLIKLWIQCTTCKDSLQRITLILQDKDHLDKISLLREIESPRKHISKRMPWLCFQLEMKTQIWRSQYETFKLLEGSSRGSVTQLNMGEGKTQIIIPMLVLNQIYLNKKYLPRVNILSPLYKEAQDNYFKFFSITGFRINIVPIYFNRSVQISKHNLNRMQYLINLFRNKSLVLIDRDSSLSMILKLRECYGVNKSDEFKQQKMQIYPNCNVRDRWMFRNIPVFDIFDEVDALMTPKKSFVYSVGGSITLPDGRIRFQFNRIFLDILFKQMLQYVIMNGLAVLQQCFQESQESIELGKSPKGLRFIAQLNESKIMKFRKKMVDFFLGKYIPPEFQFFKALSENEKEKLKQYLINSSISSDSFEKLIGVPEKVRSQIFAVRGIIAYGVFEHCLTLRCGMDYGPPGKQNIKRVGVPYEAADVPSKRSEYSHPQVATILSYLSYFNKGLSFIEFEEALKTLSNLSESSQKYYYNLWLNSIEQEDKRPTSVKHASQINLESLTQKEQLYEYYRYCRNTIVFWLVHCVFCNDLAQFNKSITASSWDLGDSVNSVGFSGTRDSKQSLPTYIRQLNSQNHEINGTDGKMIELMLHYTNNVVKIVENNEDLWKRFCSTALQLEVGCIIDAGAILAGKSLEETIIPWICNQQVFKKLGYRGISYCNQIGVWKVYDHSTHTIIDRQTSIPEHQTFVIFDEARTRGADMKMKTNVIAALSLGPNMMKDKLMQAVGRLRKFGRNQSICILSTEENFNKIDNFDLKKSSVRNKTSAIIAWTCMNSINDNKKMMYPNCKLAWIHFKNIATLNKASIEQFDPCLQKMYKEPIEYETVSILNHQMSSNYPKEKSQNRFIRDLMVRVQSYGKNYKVKCQHLEDICEREVELVEQTEKEREKELAMLTPLPEQANISQFNGLLSTLNIVLDSHLKFSKNFKQCTSYKTMKDQSNNELSQIHFVLILPDKKQMVVITQREFNRSLLTDVFSLGPLSIAQTPKDKFVVRFKDLAIDLPFIKQLSLENALVSAQFFNGHQNFEDKSLLFTLIKKNANLLKNVSVESIASHFVERRLTVQNKYSCSDLEAVCKQICNSK